MRALFVFGSIALYIACAFVPPSEANLRAFAEDVRHIRSVQTALNAGIDATLPFTGL